MMGAPKQPTKSELGKSLRGIRCKSDMTMGDLGQASGLSLIAISNIERGIGGSRDDVRTYIDALPIASKPKQILAACADLLTWPSQPSSDVRTTESNSPVRTSPPISEGCPGPQVSDAHK